MVTDTSLKAYLQDKDKFITRENEVLEYIKNNKDSSALEIMEGLGYEYPNKVRPRITELCKKNIITKSDKKKYKGKTVYTYNVCYTNLKEK